MDFLASRSIDFPHIPARNSAENRSIGPVDCDTGPNLCKHSGKGKGGVTGPLFLEIESRQSRNEFSPCVPKLNLYDVDAFHNW